MKHPWACCVCAAVASACFSLSPALASDTVEAFDAGLSDLELYTGLAGVGLTAAEQEAGVAGCAGLGVAPAFSLYLAASFATNGYFTSGSAAFELGAFATALDTEHLDLDLGFAVERAGGSLAYFQWVEVNADLEPDLSLAGLYLRAHWGVFGEQQQGRNIAQLGVSATIGAYVAITKRSQLLVELDGGWLTDAEGDGGELGEAHFGYNFQLLDNLELIHDLGIDIPQRSEEPSLSLCVGAIATMQ